MNCYVIIDYFYNYSCNFELRHYYSSSDGSQIKRVAIIVIGLRDNIYFTIIVSIPRFLI